MAESKGMQRKKKEPAKGVIRLLLKAYHHVVIDRAVDLILPVVRRSGSEVRGPIPLPVKKKRYTVLCSPHVDKKSREHFQMRVHKRLMDIHPKESFQNNLAEALAKLDLPAGVHVELRM